MRSALASLVIIVFVAILALLTIRSTAPEPPPVPDPNGYDVLVRSARMIEGPAPNRGDILGTDLKILRAWVLANREALEVADRGLDLPSGVPLSFTQADLSTSINDTGPLRMLGRLMLADLLVAHDEGRIVDAADRSIDAIRLARQSTRNGLMIHRLVGVAIEQGTGLEGLRRILDDLNAPQCLSLARTLLELDESSPEAVETLALEADWARAATPRTIRISMAVVPGVHSKLRALAAPAEANLQSALIRVSTCRRLLAIDLAIRAYRFRHDGAPPDRLDDLVPEFLPYVPVDPASGDPLSVRPADDGAANFETPH